MYLEQKRFQPYTIQSAVRVVRHYRRWLKEHDTTVYKADHSTAIRFIEYLKEQNKYIAFTINLKLAHLRYYYDFLNHTRNPFDDLKVRGEKKRVRIGLLIEDELTCLYTSLPETSPLERRVKILAGFYIFQGVSTRDIAEMKVEHLDLTRGKVNIPESQRGNGRVIELHPLQMLLLAMVFYNQIPPPEKFIYQVLGQSQQHKRVIVHMTQELRKNDQFQSLRQLRHSVVQNWLKRHNLRQVQYMAGHRYIKTTEKYIANDYEELRLALIDKHPLG